MGKQFRGVERSQEVQSKTLWRNTKPLSVKIADALEDPNYFIITITLITGVLFFYSTFSVIAFAFAMFLCWFAGSRKFSLPFRMPANSQMPDYNDLKPGGSEPAKAGGIAFLGNEINTQKEIWFKNDDMRTHLLIFGSTGAGKALTLDTLVLTEKGWKKNVDLTLSDKVATFNGDFSQIEGIFPQGDVETSEVGFEDGRFIEVSSDHLWGCHIPYSEQLSLWCNENKINLILEDAPLNEQNSSISEDFAYAVLSTDNIQLLKETSFAKEIYVNSYKKSSFCDENIKSVYDLGNQLLLLEKQSIDESKYSKELRIKELVAKTSPKVLMDYLLKVFCNDLRHSCLISGSLTFTFIKNVAQSLGFCTKELPTKFSNLFELLLYKPKGGLIQIKDVKKTGRKVACQCIKIKDPKGLFVIDNWIVTHNTEALISIAFNALVHASGFIYVDGKGDSSLFAKIFAMARAMGREDDLLVINYMTGSRDVFGPQTNKLSNTLNPFTSGSSGGLTELLVSLMDDSGGDNAMWKGRAISLIGAIMMALVHMRDEKEILLDVDEIREYLILENIIKLAKRRDLPSHVIIALKAYLKSLPGYQDGAQKQSETVNDQHGYLQMQFTKILGSLADSYGYIFRTNLGEVDFWDVVANRRILVVLLPALEKSPEELANLGKIVVACLKQMMATGLGSLLEGEYRRIIETKPTYAPTPFLCILDEYGYYAVKGAAVMPAQARSLGFSMIFAGQDYPAFEKASKEEAMSTVANCNIKIFMKLEDPKDTFDLFQKLVGEAYVTNVGGFQANTSGFISGYSDGMNANVEKRARGDLLDLKDQREGEAHIIFKSSVVRAEMFYAAPKMPKRLQLNYFLKVEPPDKSEVLEMESGMEDLKNNLLRPVFMNDLLDSTDSLQDVEIARRVFETHSKLPMLERACASVYAYHEVMQSQMNQFKSSMGTFMNDDGDDDHISVFNAPEDEKFEQAKKQGHVDLDDEDFRHPENEDDFPVFLNQQRTENDLKEVERLSGVSDEEAAENAQKIAEDMKTISRYPHDEIPEERSAEDILELLKELDEQVDTLEKDED